MSAQPRRAPRAARVRPEQPDEHQARGGGDLIPATCWAACATRRDYACRPSVSPADARVRWPLTLRWLCALFTASLSRGCRASCPAVASRSRLRPGSNPPTSALPPRSTRGARPVPALCRRLSEDARHPVIGRIRCARDKPLPFHPCNSLRHRGTFDPASTGKRRPALSVLVPQVRQQRLLADMQSQGGELRRRLAGSLTGIHLSLRNSREMSNTAIAATTRWSTVATNRKPPSRVDAAAVSAATAVAARMANASSGRRNRAANSA